MISGDISEKIFSRPNLTNQKNNLDLAGRMDYQFIGIESKWSER